MSRKKVVEKVKSYTVKYERDETGWWVAVVKELSGCHTQGRTIDQARRRIREAMGLFIEKPETVKINDEIILPRKFQLDIDKLETARKHAKEAVDKLHDSSAAAALALTKNLGVGMRDAAELLRLSHQRVHQLVKKA